MKAMIFAAGIGSRLKPFTNSHPKALAIANHKPLLQHNLERIIEFGIHDIVINTHHFAEQIHDFLKSNNNFGVNIQISDETDLLLDTGGGLRKAAKYFRGNEPILIQNVDIYAEIDYQLFYNEFLRLQTLALLAVRKRKSSRYLLLNSHSQLCGWENIQTQEKIISKPINELEQYAFSGIQIIDPRLLDLLPAKQVFGIIEVYLQLSKTNAIYGFNHTNDAWFDIGTPEKLLQLDLYLKNKV